MQETPLKILIILPCFNEEQSIGSILQQLKSITVPNCELIALPVNDASTDNTLSEIKKHSNHYLDLPVNLGIGGAVQSGLKFAHQHNFDVAVQMDGDGQHPPLELIKIITPILNNDTDVCIGSRFIDKEGFQSSFLRRAGIKFLSALIKLRCGQTVLDCTSGYRAFNKKAIEECVKYYPKKYPEPESALHLIKKGIRVKETPVIMEARDGGTSSISGFRSIYYMLKVSLAILFLRTK
ncbi:MAG: glycosyltransferase family 2 protein [Sphingobacteriaceae bacterium]|nr:glycosyltransferase family 2 protein [Sphingobacteriaceae bacterium]